MNKSKAEWLIEAANDLTATADAAKFLLRRYDPKSAVDLHRKIAAMRKAIKSAGATRKR